MSQAISLPPFSTEAIGIIGDPDPPSNPPSVTDIANAMHYSLALLNAHAEERVPGEDVVHSEEYKNKLLFTRDGNSEPLWFAGAMERILAPVRANIEVIKDDIQAMRDDMDVIEEEIQGSLRDDIQAIEDDIRHIKRVQGQVWKMAARNHNLSAGAGDDARLEVVPFGDGQDPTKDPHRLPPLTCVKDVRRLDPQQCDKYYKGYYDTEQLPPNPERIRKILLAIGAKAFKSM